METKKDIDKLFDELMNKFDSIEVQENDLEFDDEEGLSENDIEEIEDLTDQIEYE